MFWDGYLLDLEIYVGGYVESIEVGVFCVDILVDFFVDLGVVDELFNDFDVVFKFVIIVEE